MREWPCWEPKLKTLAEVISFIDEFARGYDKRSERDKRMKQKLWNEYKKEFAQKLGISEKELSKWKVDDAGSACKMIYWSEGDTPLKRLRNALSGLNNAVVSKEWTDFLLMLFDHFKAVGYIKANPSENRDVVEGVVDNMGTNSELVDTLWWDAIKKLPDALTFLRDFAYSYDNRMERDERMKYVTWDEYKDTFSMRLGVERPEMDKWNQDVVASACRQLEGLDLQSFYHALDLSHWKVHDFLLMLEGVFKQRWWIKKVK